MLGFFSFKKMVAVSFVRSIYFLVFVGINLCALVLLLNQFISHIIMIPEIEFLERHPLLWPILFLATHLFWRVFCEGLAVVFRIYEMLISIESKMKQGGVIELTEAITPKTLPKKLRARKDFREWKERRLRTLANKQNGIEGESDKMS
jgi:Domain of unknown function (DUF4282)